MASGSQSAPEVGKTKSVRRRGQPNIDDPRSITSRAAQTSFAFDRPNQPDGTLTRQGDAQSNPRHCATTHTQVNGLGFRSGIGMDAAPALGTVRDYDDLVAVIRARMIELDVTLATVDHVAGLPTNYASKLLGPKRSKRMGIIAFGAIMGALGIQFIVVEDANALARVRNRLVKRRKRLPQSHLQVRADALT